MTRRLVALGLALISVVLSFAATASAQQAASITAVGWWSRRPGAAPLPEGGFEIALLPDGPASEAALRIDVPSVPLASARLELMESEHVLGDSARILACPTSDVTWEPANPGSWAKAPPANCDTASVALGRGGNAVWTGDITSLLRGETSSIVLVPFTDLSEEQQSVTFRVVFSAARLTASQASDPTGGAVSTAASTVEPPPSVTGQAVIAGPADPAQTFTPSSPAAQATPAPDAEEPRSTAVVEEDPGEPKPWWRLLFAIPLSIAMGVGAVFVRRFVQQRGLDGG